MGGLGLGLRSQVETGAAAFLGGVEMSLPHFTGEDGICTELEWLGGSRGITGGGLSWQVAAVQL